MPVFEWLTALRLEQYTQAFQSAGYGTLSECRGLTPGDLELLGVVLPGHEKRILASLQKTFWEGRDGDQPVPSERTCFRPPPCVDGREGPESAQSSGPEPCPAGGVQDKPPPPIPPRVTLNRPPVKFTPVPVPRPRPETLPLPPLEQQQQQQGGRKPSPASPSPSSSSSSSSFSSEQAALNERSSAPGQGDRGAPLLPPKCHPGGASKEPRGPPPVPQRPPVPAPRVGAPKTPPTPR